MNTAYPWLGERVSFKKAHPDIEELRVSIEQDVYNFHSERSFRSSSYTESNAPGLVPCLNPRCQQGGIPLEQIVYYAIASQKTSYSLGECCNGHEGSPKGRRKGNPCDNHYKIDITIKYKQPAPVQLENKIQ